MKNKEAIATLEKREQLIEKKMALQEQDARKDSLLSGTEPSIPRLSE